MRFARFVTAFCVGSIIALYLNYQVYGEIASAGAMDRFGIAMGSVVILSWLLASPRSDSLWKVIKQFVGWSLFLLLLITLYSYRTEFSQVKDRVMAAIMPQIGFEKEPGTMSFYSSSNGHFHVEAMVNGQNIRFLVDTGASDVVIAPHLVESLGYTVKPEDFTKIYHTANGKGRGAPIVLKEFNIGALSMQNLPASINQAPMRTSLLGMRFFNRLKSYQVQGDVLTIRW